MSVTSPFLKAVLSNIKYMVSVSNMSYFTSNESLFPTNFKIIYSDQSENKTKFCYIGIIYFGTVRLIFKDGAFLGAKISYFVLES